MQLVIRFKLSTWKSATRGIHYLLLSKICFVRHCNIEYLIGRKIKGSWVCPSCVLNKAPQLLFQIFCGKPFRKKERVFYHKHPHPRSPQFFLHLRLLSKCRSWPVIRKQKKQSFATLIVMSPWTFQYTREPGASNQGKRRRHMSSPPSGPPIPPSEKLGSLKW